MKGEMIVALFNMLVSAYLTTWKETTRQLSSRKQQDSRIVAAKGDVEPTSTRK